MDLLAEVMKAAKKLEKMVSEETDPSQGEDMLKTLKGLPITLEILSKSKIGITVNEFRKNCKDERTRTMAKDLIKFWKKKFSDKSNPVNKSPKHRKSSASVIREDDSQDSSSHRSESPHASSSSRVYRDPNSSNPFNLHPSTTNDPVRVKSRQLLAEALMCPDNEGLDIDLLAAAIEDHIYEDFNNTEVKYKNRIRSRIANIRDPKNPDLKRNVLNGNITAERIARMTSQEMASEELREVIQRFVKESIDDHKLSVQGGSRSDFYKCSRCGERDTTYNQAQTRSADEPMTTFVLCNKCGKRWKHN